MVHGCISKNIFNLFDGNLMQECVDNFKMKNATITHDDCMSSD